MRTRFLLFAMMVAAAAPAARAQTPPPLPHAVISANAGVQSASRTFSDAFTFDVYQETAQVQSGYTVKAKAFFDGGVAVRLWRSIGAGVAVSRVTQTGTAEVSATIPHPFFFNRDRTISGQAPGIAHDETAVHVQVVGFVPAGARWLLAFSAGPTILTVAQSVVTGVSYDEAYPYDTATYRSATLQRLSQSKVGFNAGADVIFRMTPSIGVGAIVRYSQARVRFDLSGRTLEVDAGGLQAGGGIRVMF